VIQALHFGGALVACYLAVQVLIRARWLRQGWAWHHPRLAIVCWQAIGLAVGLCAIGLPLALGLAPYAVGTGTAARGFAADLAALAAGAPVAGTLPAGLGPVRLGFVGLATAVATLLVGATIRSVAGTLRAQRRHRDLLALVARRDPAAPGALVLDHPSAAAYCLPGVRPRVVVSAGTLSLLEPAQLAAVLDHERAHATERHDLVLLPFTALCRALPGVRWVRAARQMVALLVEMRADDRARRAASAGSLAAALQRFATAGPRVAPAGALGFTDDHLEARLQRLLGPARPAPVRGAVALGVAGLLLALPLSLFLA
jgi:Zn-dependent protease with chaperone function